MSTDCPRDFLGQCWVGEDIWQGSRDDTWAVFSDEGHPP